MTAFTDDLDNDLEVLAKHHDVTPVQVVKTAFALLPEHVRHDLIRSLWIATLKPWSELTAPVSEDPPDFIQERTGLPQALRGAVHELTRRYQPNLIVDAAMLEMPEEVRQNVARAFLPKKPLREKLEEQRAEKAKAKAAMYVMVDVASGEELGLIANNDTHVRVLDGKTGEPISYQYVRVEPEYDFREAEDVKPRRLALYRKVTAE